MIDRMLKLSLVACVTIDTMNRRFKDYYGDTVVLSKHNIGRKYSR